MYCKSKFVKIDGNTLGVETEMRDLSLVVVSYYNTTITRPLTLTKEVQTPLYTFHFLTNDSRSLVTLSLLSAFFFTVLYSFVQLHSGFLFGYRTLHTTSRV